GEDGDLVGLAPAVLRTRRAGSPVRVRVASYQDVPADPDPLRRYWYDDHRFSPGTTGYASYHHVSNHLVGAYAASPFAARGEDALVLVWDGGTAPRLYAISAARRSAHLVT